MINVYFQVEQIKKAKEVLSMNAVPNRVQETT